MLDIDHILDKVIEHHNSSVNQINLTPSENTLSPLSRLPFVLDAYSRYFLDDLRLFGDWSFPSGKDLGDIEQNMLQPTLKDLGKAKYINVRPISGINCMTIALAAFSEPGDTLYSIPMSAGGHPSTINVAEGLGLKVKDVPFFNAFEIDLTKLENKLVEDNPSILYIDQATFLYPIDPRPIRNIIDRHELKTIIHYDSSHLNGFIFGGATENPLEAGAHCYGGSTHKTFPGPHKGFLATNDQELNALILEKSDHFVSHHHMASVVSLAISLLEFKNNDGTKYIEQVVANTKYFCELIDKNKKYVILNHNNKNTETHQIWLTTKNPKKAREVERKLRYVGIILNCFPGLPGFNHTSYRLSVAEFTRFGANKDSIKELVKCFDMILDTDVNLDLVKNKVSKLRNENSKIQYCHNYNESKKNQFKRTDK